MAKLRPLRIEIDCVFQCGTCGTETWYTIRELKHKTHLNCPCGQKTHIEPVHAVKITYAGKAIQSFDNDGRQNGPVFPADDLVASLVPLGYTKSTARKLVNNHQSLYEGDDGKFITLLLTQGTNP